MKAPTNLRAQLTHHAVERSRHRRIRLATIDAVLMYGRSKHARGAEIYTLGWRDVAWWSSQGIDLSAFEGIEVVCGSGGSVITVYRKRKRRATGNRASPR